MRKTYTKRTGVRKASRKERKKRQAEKAREIQLTLSAEEVVVIAGQKLPIQRPRIGFTRWCGEVGLENYAQLQSPDAISQSVLK